MAEIKLISSRDAASWRSAINSCGNYDIYHLPAYHLLAGEMGEGEAFLLYFEENDHYAALPILLRPLAEIKSLEPYDQKDATSVYGYPGIVSSVCKSDNNAGEFRDRFQKHLSSVFSDMKTVSFFTRQNPLFETSWLFENFAEIKLLNKTIAIDLGRDESQQLANMTKGHRYDIRKATRNRVTARAVPFAENIDKFIEIYNDTMVRTGASNYYFFTREYFSRLFKLLNKSVKLFFAELDGEVISAALFFTTQDIIQYHLSGTPARFLKLAGSKVILDQVRRWGGAHGYRWLHLGGGVGSSEDALFRFKAGFSKTRFQYKVAWKIFDREIYDAAVASREKYQQENKLAVTDPAYFPGYRSPLKSPPGT